MPMFGVEVTVRDGPTLRLDEPWHQHHSSRSSSLARTSTNVPLLSSSDSTIIKSSTSSSEAAAVPVNTLLMTTESLSSTMSQATMSTVVAPHSPLTEVVSPPHPETTETRTTTEISVLHTSIASSPTPSTSTPQSRIGIVEQALPGVAAGVVISISLIIAGGVFFLCRRRSKIIRTRQRASARSEFREERRAGESSQPADDIVILSRDIEAQEGSGREGQEEAPDNHGVYQHEGNGGSLLGTSIHALPRKLGILAIESPPVPNTSRNSKVRFSEPVLRVALSRISTLSHHNPLRASMTTVTPDSNSRLMLDSAATRAAPVNSRGYSLLRENGQAGGILGTETGEEDQESPSDSELRTPTRQAGTFGAPSRTSRSRCTRRARNSNFRRDMNGPLAYELADLRRTVERLEARGPRENDAETHPLCDGNLSEELDISGDSGPPAYSPSSENAGQEGERVPAGTGIREVHGNGRG